MVKIALNKALCAWGIPTDREAHKSGKMIDGIDSLDFLRTSTEEWHKAALFTNIDFKKVDNTVFMVLWLKYMVR